MKCVRKLCSTVENVTQIDGSSTIMFLSLWENSPGKLCLMKIQFYYEQSRAKLKMINYAIRCMFSWHVNIHFFDGKLVKFRSRISRAQLNMRNSFSIDVFYNSTYSFSFHEYE